MIKLLAMVAVLAAALTTGLYYGEPEFRATVDRCWYDRIGWSEDGRHNDPVGFMRYAEQQLRADLAKLEAIRQGLRRGLVDLQREQTRQIAQREHAEDLAERLRDAYQRADETNEFPVEVRGEAYTREQVERRVSTLLAEAEGCRAAFEHLAATRQQAEDKLEALTVQIDGTGAQLAAMSVQREMLRARGLRDEGQQVAVQVDRLRNENRAAIAEKPEPETYRDVEAERSRVVPRPSLKSAREFLVQRVDGAASEDESSPSDRLQK